MEVAEDDIENEKLVRIKERKRSKKEGIMSEVVANNSLTVHSVFNEKHVPRYGVNTRDPQQLDMVSEEI